MESNVVVPSVNVELVDFEEDGNGENRKEGGEGGGVEGGREGVDGEDDAQLREKPAANAELRPAGSPHRQRLSAFLDSATSPDEKNVAVVTSGNRRSVSVRRRKGKETSGSAGGRVDGKRSVTYYSSWTQTSGDDEEEVWRTFAIVTETIGYILWHSVDYESERPPWKVRRRRRKGEEEEEEREGAEEERKGKEGKLISYLIEVLSLLRFGVCFSLFWTTLPVNMLSSSLPSPLNRGVAPEQLFSSTHVLCWVAHEYLYNYFLQDLYSLAECPEIRCSVQRCWPRLPDGCGEAAVTSL